MTQIPRASEFFDKGNFNNVTDMLIEFAKLHVQSALEAAANDSKVELAKDWIRKEETIHPRSLVASITIKVHEQSILNAYPLTNII